MPRQITAFSNSLVKQARGLRDKKQRRREGLFLAEGLRILTEAREAGHLPRSLFFNGAERPHPLVQALVEQTEASGGEAIETNAEILSKLSGKDNPGTVIGVFEAFPLGLDRIDRSRADLWFVAQSLRDPGNLGTILIDDCVDPFSVEAVRATMGALFTQSIAAAPWPDFLAWLRGGDGELIGTSLQARQDYQEPLYRRPAFILLGNEAQGLPAEYEEACDTLVKIPMLGRADSLNAAVAAAVMAYEVINQWRR
jgi:TrmH family RNA methyltransferase